MALWADFFTHPPPVLRNRDGDSFAKYSRRRGLRFATSVYNPRTSFRPQFELFIRCNVILEGLLEDSTGAEYWLRQNPIGRNYRRAGRSDARKFKVMDPPFTLGLLGFPTLVLGAMSRCQCIARAPCDAILSKKRIIRLANV